MKDFTRKSDGIDKKRPFKKAKHDSNIDFNTDLNDVLPLIFSFVPDARHKGSFSIHTVCKDWNTTLNNLDHKVTIDSIQSLFSGIPSDDEILLFLHDHGKQLDPDMVAMLTAMHKTLAYSIIEEAQLIQGFNRYGLLVLTTFHPNIASKLVDSFFLEKYQYFLSNKIPFKKERLDEAVAYTKELLTKNPYQDTQELLLPLIKAYEDGALPLAAYKNLFAFAFCQLEMMQHRDILTISSLTEKENAKNFICSYVADNFSKLKRDSLHPMSLRTKPIIKYPK